MGLNMLGEELKEDPLKSPEILKNIFRFCSGKDLKACRQVSKLWNIHSQQAWNSASAVVVTVTKETPGNRMSKFLNLVKQSEVQHSQPLYTHFRVSGSGGIKPFWDECGSHIKILKLEGVNFQKTEDFCNVIYKCCPNMEELSLLYVAVGADNRVDTPQPSVWTKPMYGANLNLKSFTTNRAFGSGKVSWIELLSHFPSLKVVRFFAGDQNCNDFFRSIKIIRKHDSSLLDLKQIHTLYPSGGGKASQTPVELRRVLLDPKLSLTSLSMGANDTLGGLRQVLGLHAATLKKLVLYRNESKPVLVCNAMHPLPKLQSLEELSLDSIVFTTMEFLKYMPNLKTLKIQPGSKKMHENTIISSTNQSDMKGIVMRKCMMLEICDDISLPDLRRLTQWFPRVETLKARWLDNKMFALVCHRWRNLVHLDITHSLVDESGLTGFEFDVLNRIRERRAEDEGRYFGSSMGNIRQLTHLRHLSVSSLVKITLGECFAFIGLFKLQSLQRLELENYEFSLEFLQQMQIRCHNDAAWKLYPVVSHQPGVKTKYILSVDRSCIKK